MHSLCSKTWREFALLTDWVWIEVRSRLWFHLKDSRLTARCGKSSDLSRLNGIYGCCCADCIIARSRDSTVFSNVTFSSAISLSADSAKHLSCIRNTPNSASSRVACLLANYIFSEGYKFRAENYCSLQQDLEAVRPEQMRLS